MMDEIFGVRPADVEGFEVYGKRRKVLKWRVEGFEGFPVTYTVGARYPWTVRTGNWGQPGCRELKGKVNQVEAVQWVVKLLKAEGISDTV